MDLKNENDENELCDCFVLGGWGVGGAEASREKNEGKE